MPYDEGHLEIVSTTKNPALYNARTVDELCLLAEELHQLPLALFAFAFVH